MAAFNSSPRPRGGVAQLVRALPCHGRGRGFESRRSRHHFSNYLTDHGFLSGGSLEGRQWVDFQALAKLTSSDRRQLLTARRACRPKAAVASSNRTAPSNWWLGGAGLPRTGSRQSYAGREPSTSAGLPRCSVRGTNFRSPPRERFTARSLQEHFF